MYIQRVKVGAALGLLSLTLGYGCSGDSGSTETEASSTSEDATTSTTTTTGTTETTEGPTTTTEATESSSTSSTTASFCQDPDLTLCEGKCVDVDADPEYCGGCGNACEFGWSCIDGGCLLECGDLTDCGGVCYDTDLNPEHCGGCNSPCPGEQICAAGSCIEPCEQGEKVCGAGCVDTFSDPMHCGGCDMPCPPPPANGGPGCDGDGFCTYTCDSYYHPDAVEMPTECIQCVDDEIMADNPVFYWRFSETNGNTANEDVAGADGTYVDVTLDQDGAFQPNDRAVAMGNPESGHVIIPSINFPPVAFTVEFLVRLDDLDREWHSFVSLASGDNNDANQIYIYHRDDKDGPEIDGLRVRIAGDWVWASNDKINDGLWHHVTVTWTNEDVDKAMRIYVDGKQVSTSSGSFAADQLLPPDSTLVFGQDQDSKGGGFDDNQALVGNLDSVIVYDSALDADRIAVHANETLCVKADP